MRRPPRWLRALLALTIGLCLSLLACELGLRYLLFHHNALTRALGARMLRDGQFFTEFDGDDYWKLQHLFAVPGTLAPAPGADHVLGWTGTRIDPGTYRHVDEAQLGTRTPVLLYGDSFMECATGAEFAFQGLLQQSALSSKYCALNYGVGGYGLDQIYLMLVNTLERWVEREPVVVIGILADSDFDRSVLAFRGWPKPRMRVLEGGLTSDGLVDTDIEHFLAQNPVEIQSYLGRLLAFKPGVIPYRWQMWMHERVDREAEKHALNEALLREIETLLAARHVRHFYLVFHGEAFLRKQPELDWEDALIDKVAREFGTPVVSTRPQLMAAAGWEQTRCAKFYLTEGWVRGHHNALGNLVVFDALRRALEGDFSTPAEVSIPALLAQDDMAALFERRNRRELLGHAANIVVRSDGACVREMTDHPPPFDSWKDASRLCIRSGEFGRTELEFGLQGSAHRLTGLARRVTLQREARCADDPIALVVRADERVLLRSAVPPEGLPLDIDLTGVERLELFVAMEIDGAECTWVCISDAHIE